MTDIEVLSAIVEEAVSRGWTQYKIKAKNWKILKFTLPVTGIEFVLDIEIPYKEETANIRVPIERILYSHEFAKTFWGSEEQCRFCDKKHVIARADKDDPSVTHFDLTLPFLFHLKEMVEKPNFLVYLQQFVKTAVTKPIEKKQAVL